MAEAHGLNQVYNPKNFGTKIELRVECANLEDRDYRSKSDPFVVLYYKAEGRDGRQDPNAPWRPVAKTETLNDQLSPKFATPFIVDYVFEKATHMRFEVYDEDSPIRNLNRDLKNQDFLGAAETELATLVHAPGQTQTLALRDKKGRKMKNGKNRLSMITFHVEEVNECADVVHLELAADKLPKMDWFGKGDPFFEIHRLREDGSWVKCYASEVIKNTKSPKWRRKSIKMQILNNGDPMRPIKILVFDWNKNDEPDFYGEVQTSIADMAQNKGSLSLKNDKKKKKGKNMGQVLVRRCDIEKRHTFMEYLAGGMDMQLLVAIDFTGSNGHPMDPGTLHHRGPDRLSPYLRAVYSVGNILQNYDSDGMIPVWGFGAVVNGKVNHCFPMNMNPANPEVQGIQGIVDCYHHLLDNQLATFSGPTLFQSILHNAMNIARQPGPRDRVNYQILLILTDGVINDAQQTIDAVVQASGLPLSIIIVGIGNADFSQMEVLDGDDGVLRDGRGKQAMGDIVQFVPFRQFANMPPGALAEETLKEVPDQFLSYMRRNGIAPMPKSQAPSMAEVEKILMSQQTEYGASDVQSRHPNSSAPPSGPPPPAAGGDLPPGWTSAVDQGTGRIYYVDHNSGKTQWEKP